MAKITQEDKAQLKQLIKTLNYKSLQLGRGYNEIMRKLWFQFAYLLLWMLSIVFTQIYFKTMTGAIVTFVMSCAMLLVLSLNYKVLLQPMIKQYRKTFNEALLVFDGLVRLVDWEAYRKRQLYQDTDERVEEAIDGFLVFVRKRISPADSKVFDALLVFQIVMRYSLYMWAIVIFCRELAAVI